MLFDELGESARALLRGRGRAVGDDLTRLAREHAHQTSGELADALAQAPRQDKGALGLLLARVALEEAVATRSRELFNRFLFRYGAHLKTSVSEQGISSSDRLCLAYAAEFVFDALPSASIGQRAEASAIRNRLLGPDVSDAHWTTNIGVSQAEFKGFMSQFARELGERRQVKPRREQSARAKTFVKPSLKTVPEHAVPTWLSVDLTLEPDPLVGATANWSVTATASHTPSSISLGWSAFQEHDYLSARDALSELMETVGDSWGPTSGADVLRTWNWLRLVSELASIEAGEVADVRRSWTSAAIFAARCLPDDELLLEKLLHRAIGDFLASDLASERALSVYTARLVSELGHEIALAQFSNQEKASIRSAWAEQYGLNQAELRNTATAVATVAPKLKQSTQKLYLGARSGSSPARILREASHHFVQFLDEAEGVIFTESLEICADAERLTTTDFTNHRDLTEMRSALAAAQAAISASGSAPLQDFIAPLLELAVTHIQQAISNLGDFSRPELTVQLASSKVPFSAASGSTYEMSFIITNSGNAAAKDVVLQVVESELEIDARGRVETIGPGAQAEVTVSATASGASPRTVTLACQIHWSDAMLQQFAAYEELSAEDQMPVAWALGDVNPFNLGTISEPERLVGRAADLASLDALIAGRASAYITGHKRVGKTSLTKVLLRSIRETRGWAGSLLPLGRALGQEQRAEDLVYALLDEILYAARNTYGHALDSLVEVVADDSGNFARSANRWLRNAARILPADARVIVAVDDFDELTQHLIKGPQADALFLFLRSLVDEPWLNLIVVGSEILPTIIQAQAHKLNQVVPVSVTNFASRASTAELLETPTSERLEWVVEAIDRVHYLCSGNPYYETLLAQRLWQTMRERSRSVVTRGDVDEAAQSLARETSESHFVHLWADSRTGLDHTGRAAIVASAVLRSIARCGGETLAPAAPDEVSRIAQGWIQTATADEIARATANLKSREVVRSGPSASSLLIAIPLVGVWLLEAGARALDGVYATSTHATATVRMITDSDLVALARNLRYRGEQVTEIRVRAWLEQFGDNYRQYLAFKMLRRMIMDGYFTSTRLQTTELPRLSKAVGESAASRQFVREANNQNLRNAFLVDHGVPGDSTQGTLSALAKVLKIKKANIVAPEGLPDRLRSMKTGVVLFLLDDYCGTGTHLSREADKLADVISGMGEDWVERVTIVLGASVVADSSDLPSSVNGIQLEVVGGTVLTDRLLPFHTDSGVFDTDKERSDAKEMTSSIGRALMASNPLGFGGKAVLTLFEFNCPNNVAPIFWKAGSVAGQPWVPLFERAV